MIESGGETYLRVGDELFRIYLRDMGVETELLDIVDKISEGRRIELPPPEWTRLRIVTETSL